MKRKSGPKSRTAYSEAISSLISKSYYIAIEAYIISMALLALGNLLTAPLVRQ